MDESVKRAIEQWPNVPDVYGWLSLDRRGRWLLKGETVINPKVQDFIGRNYVQLEGGGFAFQNGPQRVHVSLESTPWVVQVSSESPLQLHDQTGQPVQQVAGVWLTDSGQLVLATDRGAAMLQDIDLVLLLPYLVLPGCDQASDEQLAAALEDPETAGLCLRWSAQCLPVRLITDADVPRVLGFVRRPQAPR